MSHQTRDLPSRGRGRQKVVALTLGLALLCLGFGFQATASAGSFAVRQCGSLLANGFAGSFGQLGRSDPLVVAQGCREGGPGRAALYQDRSGRDVTFGSGGQYLFASPPEVGLGSVTASAALRSASGFRASVLVMADDREPVRLGEDSPSDGEVRRYRWAVQSGLRDQVSIRVVCVREGGCENSARATRASLELHAIELEARDRTAPVLSVPSGAGDWVSGRSRIDFAATDRGSGLATARVEVNGFNVSLNALGRCRGLRNSTPISLRPCEAALSGADLPGIATDRAPFREGPNSYRVCVADFAQPVSGGNETCSATRSLNVDNLPPGRLEDARTPLGQAWSPTADFDISWRLPADSGSPVDWLDYEVFEQSVTDGDGPVGGGRWNAGSVESGGKGQLRVPHPGVFRADLGLRDRAGNPGPRTSVTLKFDDQPPTGVQPEQPPAWLSADHLPYRPRLSQATAGGPSGVAGYALAVSGAEGPTDPCEGPICRSDELDLDGGPDDRVAYLDSLPEGRSWLSAVAVSGAGVPSREAGSVPIDVDLDPPSSSLEGLPNGWSRDPVDLRVTASDWLSGMEARPGQANPPATSLVGAAGQRVDSPGDRATMTIDREGETEIEFFARDLAGNVNDGLIGSSGRRHPPPGRAVVRIDRTAPRIWLEDVGSQGHPELVRFGVDDALSGVAGGQIALRPERGGGVTWLSTRIRGDGLEARIPSDDLPDGRYLVSAEAEDRAGNRTPPADAGGVKAWPVRLPLKPRTTISLRFPRRPVGQASLRVASGKPVPVIGRLDGGPGSGPAEVLIREYFAAGAVVETRTREVPVGASGQFRATLPAGPSRTVRATWAGSSVRGRADSRPLRLTARDAVSFSLGPGTVRNGSQVFMRGQVSGGALAPPLLGKQVAIEFFDPFRRAWRPVALVSADASGAFRFAYRFSTISSTQRIIFRARSVPEAGWPFLASASRARQVVVRPR